MNLEEPAECLDCGLECEAEDLNRCSLDAYADLSIDYDLFCPKCGSDNIKLFAPVDN
jgi:predicted Zn-ribbon and HTH transcriptional regulator